VIRTTLTALPSLWFIFIISFSAHFGFVFVWDLEPAKHFVLISILAYMFNIYAALWLMFGKLLPVCTRPVF